jgi:hypothetical protein
VKIALEDQLKTTFTTPWGIFWYTIMYFGLCKVLGTFQCLMNKVFEPLLGLFLRVFIDDFGVYSDRASHLTKFQLIFQRLDGARMTLNPKKTIIGFSEGKIVGHIMSKNGVAIDFEKFDGISKLPFPIESLSKLFGLLSTVHTHVCGKNTSFNMIPT